MIIAIMIDSSFNDLLYFCCCFLLLVEVMVVHFLKTRARRLQIMKFNSLEFEIQFILCVCVWLMVKVKRIKVIEGIILRVLSRSRPSVQIFFLNTTNNFLFEGILHNIGNNNKKQNEIERITNLAVVNTHTSTIIIMKYIGSLYIFIEAHIHN